VAAEGQGTLGALNMDYSSCGLDRVCSRPAKIIKGAKQAASTQRRGPLRKAWCSAASPFFLPAASSYHEVLTVV
jgi:hypothetical protein